MPINAEQRWNIGRDPDADGDHFAWCGGACGRSAERLRSKSVLPRAARRITAVERVRPVARAPDERSEVVHPLPVRPRAIPDRAGRCTEDRVFETYAALDGVVGRAGARYPEAGAETQTMPSFSASV